MAKTIEKLSESEKIIKSLTGQVGVDKKTLINAIAKLRNSKTDFNADIKILGRKLYEILLDNGLNESDIINIERLMDKIEGFVYQGQHEKALEILEVLDSQQTFVPFNKNGERIYCITNFLEAYFIKNELGNVSVKNVDFQLSARTIILTKKFQILFESGKEREAQAVLNQILLINPADFNANLYKSIFFQGNLIKFKNQILKSYDFAFCKQHIIEIYKNLAVYYELNKEYVNAYFMLNAICLFDDISLVENDLKRLEVEINKTSYGKFKTPTPDQMIRFINKEKIPLTIKESTFDAICNSYVELLIQDDEDSAEFCRNLIIELTGNDTELLKSLEKVAKEEREKGGK